MKETTVETVFEWLDKTTEMIEQHTNEPYLDSLVITMELLFYNQVPDHFDEMLRHKLDVALKNRINIEESSTQDIRKAVQLSILKGMKDSTQQQHLMTPETIALLVGYLAEKLYKDKDEVRLFDPVSGTANLLTTVMSHFETPPYTFASEVDPTLIKLGVAHANLQKKNIEFFHQDSLRPLLLDPVDLVVADLPVGYYPDDVRANDFELKSDESHSYAHHLLIEQSVNYTKDGGYLILVVPHFLFNSDESHRLHTYFQKHVHIICVLQLPASAFLSDEHSKSILILRKKGEYTENLKEPLLVKVPSFKNTVAMEDILGQMNGWFEQHKEQLSVH